MTLPWTSTPRGKAMLRVCSSAPLGQSTLPVGDEIRLPFRGIGRDAVGAVRRAGIDAGPPLGVGLGFVEPWRPSPGWPAPGAGHEGPAGPCRHRSRAR